MTLRALRPERRVGLLLAAAFALVFASMMVSVVLPATDPAVARGESSLDAKARAGMDVYRAQGCWYCHTQMVRSVPADALFGAASKPADYAGQDPAMLGADRSGPDLAHVGSRYSDAAALVALLTKPSEHAGRSFGHLSKRDLDALAAYLLSLK